MKKIVFLLSVVAILPSCTKKNNEASLSPLTQEGKNVVGCKVDGEVHIYYGKPSGFNTIGVEYYHYPNYILIDGSDKAKYNDEFYLKLYYPPDIVINTDYFFGDSTTQYTAEWYKDWELNPHHTKYNSGSIRFTRLDLDVIAGTFSFKAYNGNDSINITEGRFDISRN